jgi:Tfp pilus assembly protein PilF
MPCRDWIRSALPALFVALGLSGGCATPSTPPPKEHASSTILNSGPQPKVTSQQSADVFIAMGRSFEDEGKPEEARVAYESALKKDPKRADAEWRLAILDDRKRDEKNADKHFERALKLDPKNPEIFCDLGYSLYLRRRWTDAEASLKNGLAINPTHARSHTNLGLIHARIGENDQALAEFAKAGCDGSDAHANLGLVLALEGHLDEAKREYVKALAAKPNSTHAREGLQATIVALTGQPSPKAIAAKGQAVSQAVDPSVLRTSNQPQ